MLAKPTLAVAVAMLCLVCTAQAEPDLELTLQPSTQTVDYSTPFTVDIYARADTAVATAYFDVTYDSDLITATSVSIEPILNFFAETGSLGSGHIALVGGGNVAGFGGGPAVKIGTISFASLDQTGTADISLAFTQDDECALVGGGALPEGDIGFGSTQVVVPEPASVLLLAGGLAGVMLRRRSRA